MCCVQCVSKFMYLGVCLHAVHVQMSAVCLSRCVLDVLCVSKCMLCAYVLGPGVYPRGRDSCQAHAVEENVRIVAAVTCSLPFQSHNTCFASSQILCHQHSLNQLLIGE